MKPTTEILLSAAFALTPKEHWTQGAGARDADGRSLDQDDYPDAQCWCVEGALYAAMLELRPSSYSHYFDAFRAFSKTVGRTAHEWNDARKRTHAEVLDALYRAAELSEAS